VIKDLFRRAEKPLNELVMQASQELGKCYSRLELASSKMEKRHKDLFEACTYYLKEGSVARAKVYAVEVAEVRKVLSVLQNLQLLVERAILRLDTLKTVSPSLESIKEVFGDVKNAFGLVAKVMPNIMPEISKLSTAINEIMEGTQFNITMPEPIVIKDSATEAILKEASEFAEQELMKRMPEPPLNVELPRLVKPSKPLIALAADGSEVYVSNGSDTTEDFPDFFGESSFFILEQLIMDYIERHNGDLNVTSCAKELNIPREKILEALESLSRKGKIKVEQ
jgi:division protein CdvB (Snf7/Vps24/ESCRT-III family)